MNDNESVNYSEIKVNPAANQSQVYFQVMENPRCCFPGAGKCCSEKYSLYKSLYKVSFLKSSSSQRLLKSSSLGAHSLSCGFNEIAIFKSARAFTLSPVRQ